MGIRIYLALNENKGPTHHRLWDAVKGVLREIHIALNAHIRKRRKI